MPRRPAGPKPDSSAKSLGSRSSDAQSTVTPRSVLSARAEACLLLAILVVGVAVRLAFPGHLGCDHFDEGVYASRVPPGASPYPMRHMYAPPLLPELIFQADKFTRGAIGTPNAVGIVAGVLTIVVVWWIGRSWFGPVAGASAAALAATSDVHATFSRSALTDPWLVLWILLGVAFLERAFRLRRLFDLLAAGAVTGLAWWTKYNGWLPLAIGAAGWGLRLPWVIASRRDLRQADHPPGHDAHDSGWNEATGTLVTWGGAAAIAGMSFYAYIYFLNADGTSYSDIVANHRRYVVGLPGWTSSFSQQLANLRWFEGGLTAVIGPGLLAAVAAAGSPSGFQRVRGLAYPLGLGAAACITGSFLPWLLASLVTVVIAVIRGGRGDVARNWTTWLLGAWILGLLVATPCYHPYARLMLPLVAATWLGVGWSVQQWVLAGHPAARSTLPPREPLATSQEIGLARDAAVGKEPNRARQSMGFWVVVGAATVALGVASPRLRQAGVPAWQDRTQLRRAAVALFDDAYSRLVDDSGTDHPQAIFLTFGEPAAYLALSKLPAIATGDDVMLVPIGNIPRRLADQPLFLITGPHTNGDAAVRAAIESAETPRLELVASRPFQPSDILWLDHHDPRPSTRRDVEPMELRCYRLR